MKIVKNKTRPMTKNQLLIIEQTEISPRMQEIQNQMKVDEPLHDNLNYFPRNNMAEDDIYV